MWILGIGVVLGMGCIGASRLRLAGLVHLLHDPVLNSWRPAECLDPRAPAITQGLIVSPTTCWTSRYPGKTFSLSVYFLELRTLSLY
jgi:hypothetical protein